ncbi:hypothetical protein BJX64DRAFT_247262 [Aspergillus heterothallicus]
MLVTPKQFAERFNSPSGVRCRCKVAASPHASIHLLLPLSAVFSRSSSQTRALCGLPHSDLGSSGSKRPARDAINILQRALILLAMSTSHSYSIPEKALKVQAQSCSLGKCHLL